MGSCDLGILCWRADGLLCSELKVAFTKVGILSLVTENYNKQTQKSLWITVAKSKQNRRGCHLISHRWKKGILGGCSYSGIQKQ